MKTLNTHRGHETAEHVALKTEVIQVLRQWGYGAVLCEHHRCDVVAVQPGSASILGVEIERSHRNALNNITRNFSQGCAHVLVVCPDLKVLSEIARKLSRSLPPEFWARTALATVSALRLTRPNRFPSMSVRER